MIKIIEEKINCERVFRKLYFDEEEKLIYEKKIKITKVSVKYNNYILIYDSNMNVIRDAYRYLNKDFNTKNYSDNTKKSICTALKVLYAFLELFDCDIYNLGIREIAMLKQFILGITEKGTNYYFESLEKKSNRTFNKYIGYYRAYFSFLGIENNILNERIEVRGEDSRKGLLGHLNRDIQYKYKINEKVVDKRKTVPKYIRKYEFDKIIEHIRENYTLREEIIVRLMYENGLRLGEVLGLTLEDVDNEDKYRIYIRNRLSDDMDQHAKGCFFPKYKDDYFSEEYLTLDYGYQIVKPKYDLLDKIDEYIELAHGEMSERRRKNYFNLAKADEVTGKGILENGNFYIFINKNGGKLKSTGWNKILRKILNDVGIQIDRNTKKNNLSHRFRHGFAMKRYKIDKVDIVTLAKDLRHKGTGAVMCYIRPTEEDIYDANTLATDVMEKYMEGIIGDINE